MYYEYLVENFGQQTKYAAIEKAALSPQLLRRAALKARQQFSGGKYPISRFSGAPNMATVSDSFPNFPKWKRPLSRLAEANAIVGAGEDLRDLKFLDFGSHKLHSSMQHTNPSLRRLAADTMRRTVSELAAKASIGKTPIERAWAGKFLNKLY